MDADAGILLLEGVHKVFRTKRSPFHPARDVRALRGVTVHLARGESLGLVGESGSGKTTVARIMVGLLDPTRGRVEFEGVDLSSSSGQALRSVRRRLQIIFQDPASALDPRQTAFQALSEVLSVHGLARQGNEGERVGELLEMVDLRWEDAHRYPHELSGGQCQRLGIARSLALSPCVLVADEPVSQLDVSTQAQVMALLRDLKARLGLTVVLIAHDLSVVRQGVDRVGVMLGGVIVEMAPTDELFSHPLHPYTRALLAAVPRVSRAIEAVPEGRVRPHPPAAASDRGCPYSGRCMDASDECRVRLPVLVDAGRAHSVRCPHVQ